MLKLTSIIMIGSLQPKVLAEFWEKVFGKSSNWAEEGWYGWQSGNTLRSRGKRKNPSE